MNAARLDATGLLQPGQPRPHRTLLRLPGRDRARASRAAALRARPSADPAVRIAAFDEAAARSPPVLRPAHDVPRPGRAGEPPRRRHRRRGRGATFLARKRRRRSRSSSASARARGPCRRCTRADARPWRRAGKSHRRRARPRRPAALGPRAPARSSRSSSRRARRRRPWRRGLAPGVLATLLFALWPLAPRARGAPGAILRRHPSTPGAGARAGRGAVAVAIAARPRGARALAGRLAQDRRHLRRRGAGALGVLVLGRAWATRALARRLPRPRSSHGATASPACTGRAARRSVVTVAARRRRHAPRRGARCSRRARPSARPRAAPRGPLLLLRGRAARPGRAFTRTVARRPGGTTPRSCRSSARGSPRSTGSRSRESGARGREDAWRVTREYVLTFADERAGRRPCSRAAAGGPRPSRGRAWISVEAEAARALGVDLGGTPDLRHPGAPGDGRGAEPPQGGLADPRRQLLRDLLAGRARRGALRLPRDGPRPGRGRRPRSRSASRRRSPTSPSIPVRDVLQRVTGVLDRIAVAIRLVALFVLGAGLVVMAEALAQSRCAAALRVGAPPHPRRHAWARRARLRRRVRVPRRWWRGSAAPLTGALTAWIVLRFILDVPPALDAAPVAAALLASVALAVGAGFLGTFRLLGRKPLPVLGASNLARDRRAQRASLGCVIARLSPLRHPGAPTEPKDRAWRDGRLPRDDRGFTSAAWASGGRTLAAAGPRILIAVLAVAALRLHPAGCGHDGHPCLAHSGSARARRGG